jgi:hypothetical protein
MRARAKPVVVDVMLFVTNNDDGSCLNELAAWIGNDAWHNKTDLYIETPAGTRKATVGDWIIRSVAGKFCTCKPDIFEQTYELVGE